jgi:Zn-dependent M28 family amino/carboxypeptidase
MGSCLNAPDEEALMTLRRIALLSGLLALTVTGHAQALDPINTTRLVNAVNADRLRVHLEELQAIASDDNSGRGGTRALGTRGYDDSVRYVVDRLLAARYAVYLQPFTANLLEEKSPPSLVRNAPTRKVYRPDTDFTTMTYSGDGSVTAPLALAGGIIIPPTPDPSSQSGCLRSHFPASVRGKIVLIQRGTCTFEEKAVNAARAGAVGVIIFNEGQPGRQELLGGTLGNEQRIPVVGTTFAVGRELYNLARAGTVRLSLKVDVETTPVETYNVIGETRGRVSGQTVVVGAHLDSVEEGPGINDNGSGTAALLVIAEQMNRLGIRPRNTVRFAFWGAEEQGLFGSDYYVATLPPAELAQISVNLNFDMLGSPNFARFVYDGDGTIGDPGPEGSDEIEKVFVDFFRARKLASEPTEFDGRSDYFAFIEAGIPAGGLFSGAEGIKTRAQQRRYGGEAGKAYDECYHEACDDIDNLSNRALNELGKAAARSVLTFAQTRENVRETGPARAAAAAALTANYRGPHLVR